MIPEEIEDFVSLPINCKFSSKTISLSCAAELYSASSEILIPGVIIVPKIDFARINKLIDSIEGITEIRKEFYKTMYLKRYEKILKIAFDRLKE